jgi:hypothetical protein
VTWRRKLILSTVAVMALLLVGVASIEIGLRWSRPVTPGSEYWAPFPATECPGGAQFAELGQDCAVVRFEPEDPVGVGFSVRNTSWLPMTIESVESFGREHDAFLAHLEPALPPEGQLFSVDNTRPFKPVVVSPGENVTIQLMGDMRSCEAVRGRWAPGTAQVFGLVHVKVRWLLTSTRIGIPLQRQLYIEAPTSVSCT